MGGKGKGMIGVFSSSILQVENRICQDTEHDTVLLENYESEMAKVNGEKEGVGAVWGGGNGPVGGCACMEQMENVPRTGDISQL